MDICFWCEEREGKLRKGFTGSIIPTKDKLKKVFICDKCYLMFNKESEEARKLIKRYRKGVN